MMNDLNERLRYLGELARLKWQAERLGLDPLAAALEEKLLEQAIKKAAPSGRAGQRRRDKANPGGPTYD